MRERHFEEGGKNVRDDNNWSHRMLFMHTCTGTYMDSLRTNNGRQDSHRGHSKPIARRDPDMDLPSVVFYDEGLNDTISRYLRSYTVVAHQSS